jgi:hypothetical protein
MGARHQIGVFTEGCTSCQGAVAYANELAASSRGYDVRIWNVNEAEGSARRKHLRISETPAVVIYDEPPACCRSAEGEAGT